MAPLSWKLSQTGLKDWTDIVCGLSDKILPLFFYRKRNFYISLIYCQILFLGGQGKNPTTWWHRWKSQVLIIVMLYVYKLTNRLKLWCSLYQNFYWIIFQSFKAAFCGNPVALLSTNLSLYFSLGVLVLLRVGATLRLLLIKQMCYHTPLQLYTTEHVLRINIMSCASTVSKHIKKISVTSGRI